MVSGNSQSESSKKRSQVTSVLLLFWLDDPVFKYMVRLAPAMTYFPELRVSQYSEWGQDLRFLQATESRGCGTVLARKRDCVELNLG